MLTDERTTVGLDVHARSVVAEAVDWSSGQVFSQRLVPAPEEVLAWVAKLPGPVAVTYEAGPTGFGLARAFAAAGIRCVVVAPSKLERPPGDRIKTDRRDARRLARLLHIGEVTGIRIPTVDEEDARDLVRARDDTRVDLMRARHRLSKLLLRHGIVYCGGRAWTGVHERWLRSQRFELPGTRAAFDEAFDAVLTVTARRDRLDEAITVTAAGPAVGADRVPVGCRPRDRDLDRVGAGGRDRGLGPVHRRQHRRLPGPGPHRSPPAAPAATRGRSPRPATPTPGGCWSRRPGTISVRCAHRARPLADAPGRAVPGRAGPR